MLPGQTGRRKKVLPEAVTRYSMGCSCCFSAPKQYPSVAHHTIWMGKRYKELLEDIFDKRYWLIFHYICTARPPQMPASRQRDVTVFMCCVGPESARDVNWARRPSLQARIITALRQPSCPGWGRAG